ncbi:uncharacterized protein Z519_09156 [Cladophialophora bantiana CBS 173.52]|uniref:Transcription factor domain-containing protein n=1 Tax=Cladophialophora bantiana (strain ATCC 10958 / CBS 173.52 / CDC B-1940 / NIH 8579) TaxID=1442370 RepID=A0A0D2I111_CLAB1|nr:uncharacterized protein Z519_09156 [Cladophialophora bantiana CBS 173.52]KIW90509.1 hypothetical protein Z519_09156 [Cladophialophora bantiana CBS 173.52]
MGPGSEGIGVAYDGSAHGSLPSVHETQAPVDAFLVSQPGATHDNSCLPLTDNQDFAFKDMFMAADPYLSIFEDIPLRSLMSPTQDNFFEDLVMVPGFNTLDFVSNPCPDPFDALFDTVEPVEDHVSDQAQRHQQRLATAYNKLNEYSTWPYPSRAASPRSAATHAQFLEELGNLAPLADDSLIIDIFIGLFQTYITPTFPCFRGFRIESSTREEVSLAMAAAGGLYCPAPKSEMIAKWMHHFSRRKLLTAFYGNHLLGQTQTVDVLKAWILTEIFAFLSGDKRSVSLLDTYHAHLIQAVRACRSRGTESDADGNQLRQVLHAVNVLECYRVVLLQRASMLYPFSVLPGLSTFDMISAHDDRAPSDPDSMLSLLRLLTSPSGVPKLIDCPADSIQTLCALSLLLSHSCRLPSSLSKYLQGSNNNPHGASRAWRQEFLEVAFQRWLSFHTTEPSPGTMMLFHTMHISMFSSFANLEGSARDSLARSNAPSRQPSAYLPANNAIPVNLTPPQEQRPRLPKNVCFTSDLDQEKAIWHAHRILKIAESMSARLPSHTGKRVHLLREAATAVEGEPTHYSHAVYYASMVLWYSSRSETRSLYEEATAISLGIELLGFSSSPVAAVFRKTLRGLISQSERGNG